MGTCHEAILSLGYILSGSELLALLKVLRKPKDGTASDSSSTSDEETVTVGTKKAKVGDDGESKDTKFAKMEARTRTAVKLDDDARQELESLVSDALRSGDLSQSFNITMSPTERADARNEMSISFGGYSVDTWGSYDVESNFEELPYLNLEEEVKDHKEEFQKLQEVLKFKEAEIEVEETWILEVRVG